MTKVAQAQPKIISFPIYKKKKIYKNNLVKDLDHQEMDLHFQQRAPQEAFGKSSSNKLKFYG